MRVYASYRQLVEQSPSLRQVQFRNNEIEIFFYGAVNDYQQ